MVTLKKEVIDPSFLPRSPKPFAIGDRIVTKHYHLGTVAYTEKDEMGEYIVVTLDKMRGFYAYEPLDIKKL